MAFRSDGTLSGELVGGVGNAMARVKFVQYAYGRVFAKAVHDFTLRHLTTTTFKDTGEPIDVREVRVVARS